MLKEITKGEAFSNTLYVVEPEDGQEPASVRASFTVKPSRESQSRYVLNWALDFSGCSRSELLTLAARQIKVDIASKWRGDSERMDEAKWTDIVIDVAEQLRAKPAKASASQKANKLVDQMGAAEKAELLAKLQAELES